MMAITSCGYSVSGKSNPHIQTIAIPIFENETLETGVEDILTNVLIDVIQENRSLTLTSERNADSVLLGKITGYRRTVYTYDAGENVQAYKVEIAVAVEYEDRKKRKTLWKEARMIGWSTYYVVDVPGEVVEEEEAAQIRAAEKLAEDIKTKTVEGW